MPPPRDSETESPTDDENDDDLSLKEELSDSHIDDNIQDIQEISFVRDDSDDFEDPYLRSMSSYPEIKMWNNAANYSIQIERMRETSHFKRTQRSKCRVVGSILLRCTCVLLIFIPLVIWLVAVGRESAVAMNHQVKDMIEENVRAVEFLRLPETTDQLTRIVFGSCSSQLKPLTYWDTVASLRPDLAILAGDNVYGECEDERCEGLKKAYVDLANHPSFIGAMGSIPMIATLNDRDYGWKDADESNPYKNAAKMLFLNFFGVPPTDDRWLKNRGVNTAYRWGVQGMLIQVILLDVRYFRSQFLKGPDKTSFMPDRDTKKTMLSEEQWAWFEHKLTIPADVRLIVSPIQVLAEGHNFACWRMLPHEKERFLATVSNSTAGGMPIIISGDRNVGGFYEEKELGLVEVTASSWTHTIPYGADNNCIADECDETDPTRIGPFVRVNNFGSIDIDWEQRTLSVSLRRAESSLPQQEATSNAGEIIRNISYKFPEKNY